MGERGADSSGRRNVLLLGLVSFINDTSSKIILPILPLFIAELGGTGLAIGLIAGTLAVGLPILLYALYNVSYTAFAVPAGALSDRVGRRPVLFAGYGLFVLVCAGFAAADGLAAFVVLFLLFGVNYALVNATERALVSDLAEEAQRGTALGTYHLTTSLAALPAGLLAGLLWDLDPRWTFVYGAVTAAAAIAVLRRVPPEHGDPREASTTGR